MKYYLRVRGKVFGPFDEQQLLDLKDKGKLSQASELSPNKSEWSPAESFDFLFPPSAVAPKPVSTYAPPVETAVSSTTAPLPITPPPPPSGGPAEWYYSADGASGYGPVEASEVVRQIQSETLNAESLVWRSGQSARPIHAVSAFARYITPQSLYAQPMQQQQPIMQRSAMPRREFTEQATAASRSFFGWLFGWLLDFSFSNLQLQTTDMLQFQVVQLWLCRIFYVIYFIVEILSTIWATVVILFGSMAMVYEINFGIAGPFVPFLSFLLLLCVYIWQLCCVVCVRVMFEFWLVVVDWIVSARKAAKLQVAKEQTKFE